MAGGIEDTILSNISGATGDDYGEGDTGTDTTVDEGTGLQSDEGQEQVEEQLGKRNPFDRQASVEEPKDKKVDPKQKVDPKAGKGKPQSPEENREQFARRANAQVQRLQTVNRDLTTRNEELARQVADRSYLSGIPAKFGLSNDDVAQGLELVASFKSSPLNAAKAVLQLALAQGVDLNEIVGDGPEIGTKAIKQLLDQRLAPMEQERQEAERVRQLQDQGRRETEQFLSDYPEAVHHQDVIADQMKAIIEDYRSRGRNIDAYLAGEMAFNRVKQFAEQHGLDFNQPLGPQVRARTQQGPTGGRQTPGGRTVPREQTPRRPMPNGSNGGGDVISRKSTSANPDDSFSSIVRDSMKEAGYSFNQ